MVCSTCQTENETGRKFCKECGTPLATACPTCGSANTADAKYCGECGALLATAPPAVTEAPVAERRLVTVLFADLVGFTPFSEERDPEEVRETLSRWFDVASEIVARYGGTVEKFIGDAVMAVWGAPTAHEDDAERAVRAGLELVGVVPTLGEGMQARAGLLTGEAAVTLRAANQGLVAGDLVNTASRVQSVAPAGSVLVGEATYRAASGGIAFEPAGDQLLKGKTSPVPTWRALRVVAERGGRNRADTLEPPFVGREDELRLVKDLFHATGRERRIRLVSVMGPAGIGKSRLARELLKYIDGVVEDIYYHSGRSPSYGEGITFWALGEMVRARCGLLETDDEATTRAKVAETVSRWVSDEAERSWIEPALLTLLGIESGAASEELFAAWRTFFERIAAHGTVALVFEDFHFADTGLLNFVDHLLEWSKGVPLFVITLARPDLLEKRPDWGAGQRNFVSLALEPLPEPAMRELLSALVPELPESAAKLIVARADGVPLYAVETVRMLVADGRLTEQDGALVPAGDLRELAVPDSLVALISARLDALDAADRGLLQDAAVLGQSFTTAALAAVSGLEEAALEPRLAALVKRELLTREVDPRSPEHGQFAFVQALIREVAYNTLAKRDRKIRHLASARHFESLGTDELAGALASHYLAAHANAADAGEADAFATQARIALNGAADRAVALGAYDQAVTFLEQAVSVTTDAVEEAELLEKAGDAARTVARYEEAEALLQRALRLRRETGDRVGAAKASALLGRALIGRNRSDLAVEALTVASAEFADLAPDPVVASIDVNLARALRDTGQPQRAIEVAERVLQTAEQRDLVAIVAPALIAKGVALGDLGRKREGIGLLRVAEEVARENGLSQILLGALLADAYHRGDLDLVAALNSYREGLALARRLGLRSQMVGFINNLGYTSFLVGDWDGALDELEGAIPDLHPTDRIGPLSNSLIIHAARGEDVAEGIAELKRLGAETGGSEWRGDLLDVLGNAGLATGRLEESRAAWREMVERRASQASEFLYRASRPALWRRQITEAREDLADLDATGVHGRVVETRRLTLRAGLAALEGRTADALALYREALHDWRDLRQAWDEALTTIDMATLLDPTEPEIRRAAESARETLARLGARPFVERLDAALSRSQEIIAAAVGTMEAVVSET